MPARRTRKKQTRRGGSLRSAFDQTMQRLSKKFTKVKRKYEKRKNVIASRAAEAAKRRKANWFPTPTRQPSWGLKLIGKINKGKIPKIAAAY